MLQLFQIVLKHFFHEKFDIFSLNFEKGSGDWKK